MDHSDDSPSSEYALSSSSESESSSEDEFTSNYFEPNMDEYPVSSASEDELDLYYLSSFEDEVALGSPLPSANFQSSEDEYSLWYSNFLKTNSLYAGEKYSGYNNNDEVAVGAGVILLIKGVFSTTFFMRLFDSLFS